MQKLLVQVQVDVVHVVVMPIMIFGCGLRATPTTPLDHAPEAVEHGK